MHFLKFFKSMRKFNNILLIFFICYSYAFSNVNETLRNRILEDISKNNYGTEFWFSIPPPLTDNLNNKTNSIRIYVLPLVDSKIELSILSKNYKDTKNAIAGELSEFILTPETAQPYIKTGESSVVASQIYSNSAIRLSSDNPFSCFVFIYYNNSIESFLVYPVHLIKNNYTVSTYKDPSIFYPLMNSLPSIVTIVSPFDDNNIEFTMGGNSFSQTSDGIIPHQTNRVKLNKGDVWVISSKNKNADLSGSFIKSDLPISVISANQYSNIPINNKSGNYSVEMEVPCNFWGKSFLTGQLFNRKFSPIARIYAKEPNTQVFVNNYPVGTILKPYGTDLEAYLEVRLSDITTDKFYAITADKPISVTLFSTGIEEDGLPTPQGGVFKTILSPISQFIKSMMFGLPLSNSNEISGHYLNIYTELDSNNDIPDSLLLYSFQNNNYTIKKIKDLNFLIRKDLYNIDGKNYTYLSIKLQSDLTYAITSDYLFTTELFGLNNFLSYGLIPALNLTDASNLDNLPPIANWSQKCFGIFEGITFDIAEDSYIPSNIGGHLFLKNHSDNFEIVEIDKIIPGQQLSIKWKLKVIDLTKKGNAFIKFWDAASNDTVFNIQYEPSKLVFEPNFISFGAFKLNETKDTTIKLINNSENEITIDRLVLKRDSIGFELLDINKITIPSNDFRVVRIRYTAKNEGFSTDSLGLIDTCGISYYSNLEAIVGSPIIECSDIDFGSQLLNTSTTRSAEITNKGVTVLVINGYSLPSDNVFKVEFNRLIDPNNPLILKPNQSFTFDVIFTPKNNNNYVDSIVFDSDATKIDKVTLINAKGVYPGLVVSSIDFGKKKIHRNDFPSGPFYPDNAEKGVVLRNLGSKDIKLINSEIIEKTNIESFEINLYELNNLVIKKNEAYILKVAFRPEKQGESKLVIKLTDESNIATLFTLSGIGVVGQLISTNLDFEEVLINNGSMPKIQEIKFRNNDTEKMPFIDTVYIFDIKSNIDSSISEDWNNYSNQGFKFDKSKIQFPIKIAPGQYFSLPIAFAPNRVGNFEVNLNVISDEQTISNFIIKGRGIDQNLTISNSSVETCYKTKTVLENKIRNNGNIDLEILPLKFSKNYSELTFEYDLDVINGFILKAGTEKIVKINFNPTYPAELNTNLVVNTALMPDIDILGSINALSKAYSINSYLSPLEQTIKVSEKAKVKINLTASEFNDDTKFNNLIFKINYNNKILNPNFDEFVLSDRLNGQYQYRITEDSIGWFVIEIKSMMNNSINESIELIELSFNSYYPNNKLSYADLIFTPLYIDNECVIVKKSTARINIEEQCGDDLRLIKITNNKYRLDIDNTSNNQISINFEIGLSANSLLELYNINGENVYSKQYISLNNGIYTEKINSHNLSSGVYFVKFVSGPFYYVEKFILNKN